MDFDILSMDIKSTDSKNDVIGPTAYHDFEEAHKTIFVASKINVAAHDQNTKCAFFVNAAIACSPAISTAIESFSDIEITTLNKIYFDNSEK